MLHGLHVPFFSMLVSLEVMFRVCALALCALRLCRSELSLGALGAWTAYEPDLLVAIVAAHLDFQKNWNASVASRFGPPILEVPFPGVHPDARKIRLRIGTTHARQDIGVATALDMMLGLDGEQAVSGLIGASLSSVSMPIATMAAVQQVPQVSFSATSFALSNKDAYPYFLRTAPPDNIQALAIWRWILQFQVVLATCLYTTESYGQGLYNFLTELAQADDQQDRVQGQGLKDLFEEQEARRVLRIAGRMGSRFIILMLTQSMATGLIPILGEEGMLTANWQILGADSMASSRITRLLPVGFMFFLSDGRGERFPDFKRLWDMLEPEDILGAESQATYRFLGQYGPPSAESQHQPLTDDNSQN